MVSDFYEKVEELEVDCAHLIGEEVRERGFELRSDLDDFLQLLKIRKTVNIENHKNSKKSKIEKMKKLEKN